MAPAGSFVWGPRDIPHTFLVTSAEARFLMVTDLAPFADFVRALSEPAQALTLPPASVQTPDVEHMVAVAADFGIEILGPPGIPPEPAPAAWVGHGCGSSANGFDRTAV